MRTIGVAVALGVALVVGPFFAAASTLLDYVTFDGIDYIRWAEEPGRELGREDLGSEFAIVECSFGEDLRGCPYGVDASAAFLPAGTRMYAVRGHATTFRLAAVWRDRIFLYQAWRNPHAKVATDLYDIASKVRGIDVRLGEPPLAAGGSPAAITAPSDRAAPAGARGRRAPLLAHLLAQRRHHAEPGLFPRDARADGWRGRVRRLHTHHRALSGRVSRAHMLDFGRGPGDLQLPPIV
jgi:hypothetical protein